MKYDKASNFLYGVPQTKSSVLIEWNKITFVAEFLQLYWIFLQAAFYGNHDRLVHLYKSVFVFKIILNMFSILNWKFTIKYINHLKKLNYCNVNIIYFYHLKNRLLLYSTQLEKFVCDDDFVFHRSDISNINWKPF